MIMTVMIIHWHIIVAIVTVHRWHHGDNWIRDWITHNWISHNWIHWHWHPAVIMITVIMAIMWSNTSRTCLKTIRKFTSRCFWSD